MEKIILASNNIGKKKEFTSILGDLYNIVSQQEINIKPAVEDGLSFIENAIIKARNAARQSGLTAIADDSGIMVDALYGAPGIYSARYAGTHCNDEDNLQKLLTAMKGTPYHKRSCRFWCAIAFIKNPSDVTPITAQGSWDGQVLYKKIGKNGFGYDPIFYVPTHKCSAAQLPANEKNKISHRACALQALLKILSKPNL